MQRVKIVTSKEEYAEKLKEMRQTASGAELLDGTPMAPPIGYVKHPSMVDIIRQQIRSLAMEQAALAEGKETFNEADDFDIPDDLWPASLYEFDEQFEPPVKVVAKDMPAAEHAEGDRQGAKPAEGGAEGDLDEPAPKRAKATRRAPKAPEDDSAEP